MQTLAQNLTNLTFPLNSASRSIRIATNIALLLAGSLVIAICAQISIPFVPIPLTLQTFGVLLVGAALGKRRALGAVLIYLAEGMAGLPVFAGGASGALVLMGPRGGFLLGFVLCAYIVGMGAERGLDRSWKTAVPLFIVGDAVVFLVGLAWLREFVPADQVLAMGLWPFLPGEALKIALASSLMPYAWKKQRNS